MGHVQHHNPPHAGLSLRTVAKVPAGEFKIIEHADGTESALCSNGNGTWKRIACAK